MFDVVVVGGANTDFLARASRLPRPSETFSGETFVEGPGGKGANQAVAAARLGSRVAFIAGKKLGGAVVRNRCRRVLREAVRHENGAWPGWDVVEATMPQAEIGDLIIELRSATAGVASYRAVFDHMAELTGRLADEAMNASGKAA